MAIFMIYFAKNLNRIHTQISENFDYNCKSEILTLGSSLMVFIVIDEVFVVLLIIRDVGSVLAFGSWNETLLTAVV